MNILPIVKVVAGVAASVGVGAVVGNAVKLGTPESSKLIQKIVIGVGGFVLSSMVADHASNYVEAQIDNAADQLKTALPEPSDEV